MSADGWNRFGDDFEAGDFGAADFDWNGLLDQPDPTSDSSNRLVRERRLHATFDGLNEAFVDLSELISEYVESVRVPGDVFGETDVDRFLGWLKTHYGLTEEQYRRARGYEPAERELAFA